MFMLVLNAEAEQGGGGGGGNGGGGGGGDRKPSTAAKVLIATGMGIVACIIAMMYYGVM